MNDNVNKPSIEEMEYKRRMSITKMKEETSPMCCNIACRENVKELILRRVDKLRFEANNLVELVNSLPVVFKGPAEEALYNEFMRDERSR